MIPDSGAGAPSEPAQPSARSIAEKVPALPLNASVADIVDACLSADEHDWIVLLDDADRPVRLVQREALLRAEEYEFGVDVVSADQTPAQAALLAVSRPRPACLRPLACCDARGRYRGVVRVDTLLRTLAEAAS